MSRASVTSAEQRSVLIVDDEPNIALALEYLMKQSGYQVRLAHSGEAALAALEQEKPDVILMDIVMPGIDGLEICRRLKAAESTRDIPVIFMTAQAGAESKLAGFDAGGVDYVTKPFQLTEVVARVGAHASLRAMQRELARQNTALQRARDELEQRVIERTAELAQTNASLRAEIGERRRAEEMLREQQARIRRLVDSNIIGIIFWNLDGGISDANDAFLQIVGYAREDLSAGKIDWSDMTPPEYRAVDEQAMDEMRQRGSCTPYEKEYIRADGSRVPVVVGGALFEDSQHQGVAFVLDLTAQKRAEDRIRFLAQHDALTSLPNRMLFTDRVAQAIAQARRQQRQLAILFVDLDHFKHVNDSLGHRAGDRLLRAVARRLRGCVREGDSVARLGGDEFVINLLFQSGGEDAAHVAEKVSRAVAQPVIVDGHELHITASIGISLHPSDGDDAEALMRAADTALYYAKERGRHNYQFFTAAMNESAQRRLGIANSLHHAIARAEFSLQYQPQAALDSGRIVAAEALIRWRHAGGGLIAPSAFIKIAEETGQIAEIGEWVLKTACEQLRSWRAQGHALRMAVNISPQQLRQAGFREVVARILDECNLPPGALELEFTEGVLMMHDHENVWLLQALATLGVQLAIDDFGTGYSSLVYLQRFPINTLKIDQSFVSGIGVDPHDTAIVAAVSALAESLKLNVIAEGVETAAQAAFLERHGCRIAQGFYFSPPQPAAVFDELLAHQARLPLATPPAALGGGISAG